MSVQQVAPLQRVISIRTPENIELRYALAGPGSRAAAYFIDFMLMFALGQLLANLLLFGIMMLLASLGAGSELWAGAIVTLFLFALYNGYFIVLEWLMNGQTPGKRIIHIRVIKQGGYSLRFFDTLLRNLLRVIDFIPLFYGVGLLSLLVTRHSQRLGDLVAGTLVVYQEPVQTESLLPALPEPSASDQPLPAAQLSAIPSEVISLSSEFLRSRADLAPRPRQELGAELVGLIQETSGLEVPQNQSVERFLECVLRQSEQTAPWSSQTPQQA